MSYKLQFMYFRQSWVIIKNLNCHCVAFEIHKIMEILLNIVNDQINVFLAHL